MRISSFVALALAASAGRAPAQSPRATADVPVTRVMLFSSGVGYFEHAGTVRGNSATELRFKTSQINDILKSLVLDDRDGGHVAAITYPSQDPIDKALKSFQVDITGNPSLAQLLNQLRGARVTVQAQAANLTGTIMGVETRRVTTDRGTVDQPVLDLLSGATIRAIDLSSISNLSLDDPQLQEELSRALGALAQARDQDRKPVTIDFTGSGVRRVRIGYVVETPVWKTSYRLVLNDTTRAARLQGWAIVENQTESDWNDVSLSLVSGRPISFMMDLYRPLYATRPTVTPELFASLRPQLYGAGIDTRRDTAAFDMRKAFGTPSANGRVRAMVGSSIARMSEVVMTASGEPPIDVNEAVNAAGTATSLGALFHYTVPNVTLARQKSAMLPIIADDVGVERVSIYNSSVLATNPLIGVRLTNSSGKHLLQGPVTVLDNGGYAGDARIDDVPPGQERLLSYGIDLEMRVDDSKRADSNAVRTAKIDKGLLIVTRKLDEARTYVADNQSAKDKTLIIEHPVMHGWTLVDTPAPVETTPSVYRFKGVVAAHKVSTFTVQQEIVTDQSIAMLPSDIGQLVQYTTSGAIPAAVRDAIAEAIRLKQAVTDAQNDMNARTARINEITAEQARIRENMKTVSQTTDYYQRLLGKLNAQESSIEAMQRERDQFSAARDAARVRLEAYLATLTVG
ncbi:MAG TPA: DUF4139 domain-containing protein [Gemmatimonadaceae bacterium]|nr:DUF4139 domain-containing protein [Gemmatimonadaceae bacterium]